MSKGIWKTEFTLCICPCCSQCDWHVLFACLQVQPCLLSVAQMELLLLCRSGPGVASEAEESLIRKSIEIYFYFN